MNQPERIPASEVLITEEQARQMPDCIGCGAAKADGLVVCWPCFKNTPLKYVDGSLSQWVVRS